MGVRKMTMREVVGDNIRGYREERRLTQDALRQRLETNGLKWSRSTLAQCELGNRPTSVDEVFILAWTLATAPHLFFYPPPRTEIVGGKQSFPAETIADWIYMPDTHPFTKGSRSERAVWAESARMAERLTPEGLDELRAMIEREEWTRGMARFVWSSGHPFVPEGVKPGAATSVPKEEEDQT